MSKEPYQEELNKILAAYPQVQRAFLFGSRAKGTAHDGSDIDLALEGDNLDHSLLISLEEAIDDLYLPVKVDLLILDNSVKDALRDHVRRVGIEWYHA